MATENIDTSNQSTTDTDSASLLERSPWGRVIDTTGSPDAVLQGFGSATGGDTSGGAPSGAGGGAGGGAGSGNPFTNFGNPNAEGSPLTGGTNPWAAIGTSGSSAPSGGDTSGGGSTGGFGGGSTGGFGGDTSGADSTDAFTGASSGGDISGAGGFGGGAGGFGGGSQGGGSQGGIDFGSATESSSFQNRILIDQFIAAGPTDQSTEELSSQITNNIVNQVSYLGSTSSDGGSDTQFGGGGNLNAGTDTQFSGGTQLGGDSIPFA